MPFYHRKVGLWVVAEPPPAPPPAPPSGTGQIAYRNSLTYGQYIPTGSDTDPVNYTAGVPSDVTLTDYNSSTTDKLSLAAGTVITEKVIYGDITPLGDLTINSCLLVGGTSTGFTGDSAVVNCTSTSRPGRVVINDSTIKVRTETNGRNGILGCKYDLYRCDVSGGTDCVGIYSKTAGVAADAKVVGNYLHNTTYVYPDTITTSHSDGTHNDCIQYQGGLSVLVMGNRIKGTSHALAGTGTNPTKSWLVTAFASPDPDGATGWTNGAGIIVQRNVGDAPDASVIVEQNFFSGGLSHLNGKSTALVFVYRSNQHYRDTAVHSGWQGYWMRFDAGMSIAGISGVNTNVWIDGPYAGQILQQGGSPSGDLGILIG